MVRFFETNIEFLKGVGPQRADLLKTEIGIHTYADLIQLYPFRYDDRSKITTISELHDDVAYIQLKGIIIRFSTTGEGPAQRLKATFKDSTGVMELVWFQGVNYMLKYLKTGVEYLIFGKPNVFNYTFNIVHPEMDIYQPELVQTGFLSPVYSVPEKLKKRFIDSKLISKLQRTLLDLALAHVHETLPSYLLTELQLKDKVFCIENIHFPKNTDHLSEARHRLKFEELFYTQIKMLMQRKQQKVLNPGFVFKTIPKVNAFYKEHLPFDLTDAQKRVIREIYQDMGTGRQMNRLLQGDVGSGKTIVAFIAMLMAVDNGTQACIMAPTEILSDQHYEGLKPFADLLDIKIAKLTGSTKASLKKSTNEALLKGEIDIIVGTHALLEDSVAFKTLGVCIIDEQHRFGVAQRAKLWKKNASIAPHILVMTATPIPRTLAMTLYGDLDVSVIDELPKGRKPIKTVIRRDSQRLAVFGFVKDEIQKGRQVYIVYPLIEESEKSDLKDLMDGYESVSRAFPDLQLSIVHGKMKPKDKDFEMQRFIKGETSILVATTVIEVGVNVPNASLMIVENSERFGLSQLHQLRGRVGRGAEQSYCILMASDKVSKDGRVRLDTLASTNNGFEIADVDLKLRGPGDLAGLKQSGVLDLLIADLAQDADLLTQARALAVAILEKDVSLHLPENKCIKFQVETNSKNSQNWARIS